MSDTEHLKAAAAVEIISKRFTTTAAARAKYAGIKLAEWETLKAERQAIVDILGNQDCECAEDVDMMHVGTDRCAACQISSAMGFEV
ncbi:MAG: hypothetical protein RLZZ200_499 [Pseudomonadota bacterium]